MALLEDIDSIRRLTTEVQETLAAYAKQDSTSNYKELQTRVRRLQIAATAPEDTLFAFRLQINSNIAVTILNELGAFEALQKHAPEAMTAAEIAAETECEPLVIERAMRLACALGFSDECGEATYKANRITALLVEPGWRGALEWMDLIYPVASNVRSFMKATRFGRAGSQALETAFTYTHHKSMWAVLEDHPDQRRNFDVWMRERKKHEEKEWRRRFLPLADVQALELNTGPDATLMVDIGGAHGSQLRNFKAQFPEFPGRLILQDLPEALNGLPDEDRIEVMAYDFFTPQPIKGARFYYLRNVLHNWPDDRCAEILRNVVPAMDPEYSTLLIDDYVLPSTGAQLRSALADVHMMAMFNSSERTSQQYRDMLAAVGLKIVAIHPAGVNEEAIIEARVASKP